MVQKIFKCLFVKFLKYVIDFICIFLFKSSIQRSVVVIRTDAIGDYLLFRNFLEPIYRKYGKITLIGNSTYRSLVDNFDSLYLNEFIAINRVKFKKNVFHRICMIKYLRKTSYRILINPIYSRDIISEDIVKLIIADKKIASSGDYSNLSYSDKQQYDKNYHLLLPSSKGILFEFHRNLEFFRNILDQSLDVEYSLDLQNSTQGLEKFNLQKPYSILFIGASEEYRKWSAKHFAEVGNFLLSQGMRLVICGGFEDYARAEEIQEILHQHQEKILNLCGQTSLVDLARIVYNGNHLVSNETSCVHIAHSIRHDKIIVVSNGNHLYRFTPYPKDIGGKSIEIYHPAIQKNLSSYALISNFLQQQSKLNIDEIKSKSVISAIQKLDTIPNDLKEVNDKTD